MWEIQKEDHGSVGASSAISGGKKSQTWDLVWVTGGPLETIFVKTFFQNFNHLFFSYAVSLGNKLSNSSFSSYFFQVFYLFIWLITVEPRFSVIVGYPTFLH